MNYNTSQNHNERLLYLSKNGYCQKKKIKAVKDVGKKELLYTSGRKENVK